MKFWTIVGLMLPVFTLNKATISTSQCDKATFVENCKTQNFTAQNISSVCKRESFPNQTITEASTTQAALPTRKNENVVEKRCSNMWSLCCHGILTSVHIVSANNSLSNDNECWRNDSDQFNCSNEDFSIEMVNVPYSCPICEIQRSKNAMGMSAKCFYRTDLRQIARLVECVIQRWNLGKADIYKDLFDIEELLQITKVEATEVLYENSYMALLYKPTGDFSGLEFDANESQISLGVHHSPSKMSFRLPKELRLSGNETLIFLTLQLPNQTADNSSMELIDRRLFGLSVSQRRVSGLKETANFTITFTPEPNKIPKCVFMTYSTKDFSSEGCRTEWNAGQNSVTCFCDHFTYFGVLLVSPSLSPGDVTILTYITSIGCGISLVALVVTAFLLITNRELQTEDSKKIHANLVVALILLNLHLLLSEMAAESSYPGVCLYVALAIHYSLLATFCWVGLEGFHLFRLMVKVFNLYINGYMLKVSLVGWGVPALIVSVVVLIKMDTYGPTQLSESSRICYIRDETLKYTTTLGLFSLVFLFNTFTFVETMRYMFAAKTPNLRKRNLSEVRRDRITPMILVTLLGLTWGLIFFSFGKLTTPGLYIFSVINSLQGFFIFLYIA